MAWSDAARKAAAQARKFHAQARRSVAGKGQAISQRLFREQHYNMAYQRTGSLLRKSLSQRIRGIRAARDMVSERGTLTGGAKMIMKSAAENTAVRNHLKRGGKILT